MNVIKKPQSFTRKKENHHQAIRFYCNVCSLHFLYNAFWNIHETKLSFNLYLRRCDIEKLGQLYVLTCDYMPLMAFSFFCVFSVTGLTAIVFITGQQRGKQ